MNLRNLKILRDFVAENKHKLNCNMRTMQTIDNWPVSLASEACVETEPCLTSCCFLGCGPLAGLAARPEETWRDYSKRVFWVDALSDLWDFLFSGGWPNDFDECIARADKILNGFNPETERWCFGDRYVTNTQV